MSLFARAPTGERSRGHATTRRGDGSGKRGRGLAAVFCLLVSPTLLAADVFLDFPASVDAATRARIKKVMQEEFDDAGAGLTVTDDATRKAGAARTVRFVDGFATPKGDRWGDSNDGKTVRVYVKEFTDDPAVKGEFGTAMKLGNGLGETAAHEVGHTYGLGHNWDDPPTKMTEGSKVSAARRAADSRLFNATDKLILRVNTNPGILDLIPKPLGTGDVLVAALETPTPVTGGKLEDLPFVDAALELGGPLAGQFDLGYLVAAAGGGLSFGLASPGGTGAVEALTLANEAVIQWALQGVAGSPFEGQVLPVGEFGTLELLNPRFNPFLGKEVFGLLSMQWDIDRDSVFDLFATLDADAFLARTGNGFLPVPEPLSAALLLTGLLALRLLFPGLAPGASRARAPR